MANCAEAQYDARWHQDIEETVGAHDIAIRGNGVPGLNHRVRTLEDWRESEVKRMEEDARSSRELRLVNRAQLLALAGLIVMAILQQTGIFSRVPVIVQSPPEPPVIATPAAPANATPARHR